MIFVIGVCFVAAAVALYYSMIVRSAAKQETPVPIAKAITKDGPYKLTPEHHAALSDWVKKQHLKNNRVDPLSPDERVGITQSVHRLYDTSGRQPPTVVFADGPVSGSIAAGISKGVWYLRENPDVFKNLFDEEFSEERIVVAVKETCEAATQSLRGTFISVIDEQSFTDRTIRTTLEAAKFVSREEKYTLRQVVASTLADITSAEICSLINKTTEAVMLSAQAAAATLLSDDVINKVTEEILVAGSPSEKTETMAALIASMGTTIHAALETARAASPQGSNFVLAKALEATVKYVQPEPKNPGTTKAMVVFDENRWHSGQIDSNIEKAVKDASREYKTPFLNGDYTNPHNPGVFEQCLSDARSDKTETFVAQLVEKYVEEAKEATYRDQEDGCSSIDDMFEGLGSFRDAENAVALLYGDAKRVLEAASIEDTFKTVNRELAPSIGFSRVLNDVWFSLLFTVPANRRLVKFLLACCKDKPLQQPKDLLTLSFFKDAVGLMKDCDRLVDIENLFTTDAVFMSDKFCIIAENPTIISPVVTSNTFPVTVTGGPAVQWQDSIAAYYHSGMMIPRSWVEDPASIDIQDMFNAAGIWTNIERRRVAIDLMGWARVLDKIGAKVVDEDPNPQIGTLLSADLPNAPDSRFLKVQCGTGRLFVLPVPPEMTTAAQANAWTFDMTEDQLRKMEVRT